MPLSFPIGLHRRSTLHLSFSSLASAEPRGLAFRSVCHICFCWARSSTFTRKSARSEASFAADIAEARRQAREALGLEVVLTAAPALSTPSYTPATWTSTVPRPTAVVAVAANASSAKPQGESSPELEPQPATSPSPPPPSNIPLLSEVAPASLQGNCTLHHQALPASSVATSTVVGLPLSVI